MKSYKSIIQEIKKNREAIEAKTAEIIKLDYKEEKKAAINAENNGGIFNNAEYKALAEKARENAGEIAKLSNDIYVMEIKQRILQSNAKVALINEAIPVILAACEKYNNKPYGDKTREKIHQEVKLKMFQLKIAGIKIFQKHIDMQWI